MTTWIASGILGEEIVTADQKLGLLLLKVQDLKENQPICCFLVPTKKTEIWGPPLPLSPPLSLIISIIKSTMDETSERSRYGGRHTCLGLWSLCFSPGSVWSQMSDLTLWVSAPPSLKRGVELHGLWHFQAWHSRILSRPSDSGLNLLNQECQRMPKLLASLLAGWCKQGSCPSSPWYWGVSLRSPSIQPNPSLCQWPWAVANETRRHNREPLIWRALILERRKARRGV